MHLYRGILNGKFNSFFCLFLLHLTTGFLECPDNGNYRLISNSEWLFNRRGGKMLTSTNFILPRLQSKVGCHRGNISLTLRFMWMTIDNQEASASSTFFSSTLPESHVSLKRLLIHCREAEIPLTSPFAET